MQSDATGYSQFIDLVPSRVIRTIDACKENYVNAAEDVLWHRRTDLRFQMAVGLSEGIRRAVIQEWGCEIQEVDRDLQLHVRGVRLALVSYVEGALRWRVYQENLHEVWIAQK